MCHLLELVSQQPYKRLLIGWWQNCMMCCAPHTLASTCTAVPCAFEARHPDSNSAKTNMAVATVFATSSNNRKLCICNRSFLGEALRAMLVLEVRQLTVTSQTPTLRVPAHLPAGCTALRCEIQSASGGCAQVVLGGPQEGVTLPTKAHCLSCMLNLIST